MKESASLSIVLKILMSYNNTRQNNAVINTRKEIE